MLPFFSSVHLQEGKPVCSWWWKKTIPLQCECVEEHIANSSVPKIANVFESAFQWSYFARIEHTFSIDIVTVNILLNILDCIHSSTLSSVHTKKNYIMVHRNINERKSDKKVELRTIFLSECKRMLWWWWEEEKNCIFGGYKMFGELIKNLKGIFFEKKVYITIVIIISQ